MKEFNNFDKTPDISTVEVKFKIHKAELKDSDFEANIEDISRLSVKTSFITQFEG